MDPEIAMRELEAKAEAMRLRSEQMQEEIQNAYATASSKDGAVTVKVAPNGALQHIEFSPRATQMSHLQLGQIVMEVAQRAQADAARLISEIVAPEFGDTDAMSFLTGFLPSDDDESGPDKPKPAAPPVDDYDDFDDDGGSFLR